MIQFNLLPAVKQEYVKAQHNKRVTLVVAGLVTGVAVLIMVVLFAAVQIIGKHSRDLSADIKTESSKLEGTQDINKILTIQNQLGSLTALHDAKPVVSRLLGDIKQITPAQLSIAKLDVDFDANTMTINGSGDSLKTVNTFVDTLKFTKFQAGADAAKPAFSAVVLSSFGRDDKGASYTISLSYDPAIFSSSADAKLIVTPGMITTRSETEKPADLFQPLSNTGGGR